MSLLRSVVEKVSPKLSEAINALWLQYTKPSLHLWHCSDSTIWSLWHFEAASLIIYWKSLVQERNTLLIFERLLLVSHISTKIECKASLSTQVRITCSHWKSSQNWFSPTFFILVPLDDIREYFGETIGLYFGFLGFYSLSLVPPVLLVVVFALSGAHEQTKNTVFAVLNLIWATVFLEAWKRRCSEISFKWGTLKSGIGKAIFFWFGEILLTEQLSPSVNIMNMLVIIAVMNTTWVGVKMKPEKNSGLCGSHTHELCFWLHSKLTSGE